MRAKDVPPDALTALLNDFIRQGHITNAAVGRSPAWGERYKKFTLLCKDGSQSPYHVDLFVVKPPAQWGAILTIRTGPNDFNKVLMGDVLPRRGPAPGRRHRLEAGRPAGRRRRTDRKPCVRYCRRDQQSGMMLGYSTLNCLCRETVYVPESVSYAAWRSVVSDHLLSFRLSQAPDDSVVCAGAEV